MIILKYHRRVSSPDYPSYVSNATLAKIYGIDASSIGRLIKKRFVILSLDGIKT